MRKTTPREIINVINSNASSNIANHYFLTNVFLGREFFYTTKKGQNGTSVKYDPEHDNRFLDPGEKQKKALRDGRLIMLKGLKEFYNEILDDTQAAEAAQIKQGLYALLDDCKIPTTLLGGLDTNKNKCIFATYVLYLHAIDYNVFSDVFREELHSIIKEETPAFVPVESSRLTTAVRVLLSAYNPGNHKHIEFTRYTLYLLCRHFYPSIVNNCDAFGITAEGPLEYESTDTAQNTTESFRLANFNNDELLYMQEHINFCVPVKKNKFGQNTPNNHAKKLLVFSKLSPLSSEEIKHSAEYVLNLLLEVYNNLPVSFHNNVEGRYKIEINTTLSEFVLFMAYQGCFRSEIGQARLLDIGHLFVRTHNQHHSYMYSFFEKGVTDGCDMHNQIPLFQKFDPDNDFCKQVLIIVKQFYEDVFLTTNAHIYWGGKFISWIGSNSVIIKNLLDQNCYDAAVWLTYRDLAPQINEGVLRSIITDRLLNNAFNLGDTAFLHNLLAFLQLITKLNTGGSIGNWLLFVPSDQEYTQKVFSLMRNVLIRLPNLPKNFWRTINQALHLYLSTLPKEEQILTQKSFIQSCAAVDWNKECYGKHFLSYKNVAIAGQTQEVNINFSPENSAREITRCAKQIRSHSSPPISQILKAAKDFTAFGVKEYDTKALADFEECLVHLLEKNALLSENPSERYIVILQCYRMWSALKHSTQQRLIDYASDFLSKDYYKNAKESTIINALRILSKDAKQDHLTTFEFYFNYYAEQNSSKNYDNLRVIIVILEIYTQCQVTKDMFVQKLRLDPLYAETLKTLCDSSKNHMLKNAIRYNPVLYSFLCDLLVPEVFWSLLLRAQLGLAHFAKKNERLRQQFSYLLDDSVSNWDNITEEKIRYALVCHILYFYEIDERPKCVNQLLENLLEEAHQDLFAVSKKCGTKPETFLIHLVRLFKDHPEKTAILCAKEQAKLLGQIRHELGNTEFSKTSDAERREGRKGFLPFAISNPSIRQFSIYYCRQMRSIILDNPMLHYDDILATLNKAVRGEFPDWDAELQDVREYVLDTKDIPVLSINIDFPKDPPSVEKLKNISENEGNWTDRINEDTGVYTPKFDIVICQRVNGTFDIIDGKNTLYWLQQRAIRSGDCSSVRVLCLSLHESIG